MADLTRKKFLDTKYWFMFWSYRCFDQNIDRFMKDRIMSAEALGAKLRGDAAYFLLLNFDQMLLRVEGPHPPLTLDPPPGHTSAMIRERYSDNQIAIIFDLVFDKLRETAADNDGYSAHQVMRAVDGAWPDIIKYVLWE